MKNLNVTLINYDGIKHGAYAYIGGSTSPKVSKIRKDLMLLGHYSSDDIHID